MVKIVKTFETRDVQLARIVAREAVKKFRRMIGNEGWDIGRVLQFQLEREIEAKVRTYLVGEYKFTKEQMIRRIGGKPPKG